MRKFLAFTVGLVVALAIGYGAGRYVAPAKIVETEVVKEVEKEVVVTRTKAETKVVYVERTQVDREKETKTEKRPDGTEVTTVVERDKSRTEKKEDTGTKAQTDQKKDRTETTESSRTKLVLNLPDWSVDLHVGTSLFGDRASLQLPKVPDWLVVGVQRRIVGGVYAGVYAGIWGNSQGAVGVSVRFSF